MNPINAKSVQLIELHAFAYCLLSVSLSESFDFPGSDQYKIKSATKEYVKSQLGEGEKFRYGYLERKCGRNVDGKFCKYAEVHYEVISASGETSEKMLFLLMSEHCDSVLDISEERDKEWTNKETLSSEEIKAIIESALKDKL